MSTAPPEGPIVVVCGTTASRKSELAVALAEAVGGELICCDSVQMYRGFVVGSAAPTPEELARAPHHLYGSLEPDDPGDAGRYALVADQAIEGVRRRGHMPIVVGGTGLYLRALLFGLAQIPAVPPDVRERLGRELRESGIEPLYERLAEADPDIALRIEGGARNTQRVLRALEVFEGTGHRLSDLQAAHRPRARYDAVVLSPTFPTAVLNVRIDRRVDAMLHGGLAREVAGLLERGVSRECRPMRALGYRQMADMLSGEIDEATARRLMKRGHRRYAKRQRTWFGNVEGLIELDGGRSDLLEQALAHIPRPEHISNGR